MDDFPANHVGSPEANYLRMARFGTPVDFIGEVTPRAKLIAERLSPMLEMLSRHAIGRKALSSSGSCKVGGWCQTHAPWQKLFDAESTGIGWEDLVVLLSASHRYSVPVYMSLLSNVESVWKHRLMIRREKFKDIWTLFEYNVPSENIRKILTVRWCVGISAPLKPNSHHSNST